jgi:hypothetical protein
MWCKFGRVAAVPEGVHVFVYLFEKFLSVCPMYAFPQSGHVNLYTPVTENFVVVMDFVG